MSSWSISRGSQTHPRQKTERHGVRSESKATGGSAPSKGLVESRGKPRHESGSHAGVSADLRERFRQLARGYDASEVAIWVVFEGCRSSIRQRLSSSMCGFTSLVHWRRVLGLGWGTHSSGLACQAAFLVYVAGARLRVIWWSPWYVRRVVASSDFRGSLLPTYSAAGV